MARRRIRRKRHKTGGSKFFRRYKNVIAAALTVLILVGIALTVFVVLPAIQKNNEVGNQPTPTPTTTQNQKDFSEQGIELVLVYKSINDPFIYKDEILFASGEAAKKNPKLESISSVDISISDNTTAVQLEGVESKYDNIMEPIVNDKYIIFLDVSNGGGGRVCVYDREAKKTVSIRDYSYAAPHVCLNGDYAAFSVQVNPTTDKLYLCHLPTQEIVTVKEFKNNPSILGGVCLTEDALVWSQVTGASTSGGEKSIIYTLKLDGSSTVPEEYNPNMFVYSPTKQGDYLFFLDKAPGNDTGLYMSKAGGTPESIATGIINYKLGDGYVAYTKDDAVYLYFYVSGTTASMNSKNTRGLLASVYGDRVCWYDITDGFAERDVVKYAEITNLDVRAKAQIGVPPAGSVTTPSTVPSLSPSVEPSTSPSIEPTTSPSTEPTTSPDDEDQ